MAVPIPICAMMTTCEGYDKKYCDKNMCTECALCDKNLRAEYLKANNVCGGCNGYQMIEYFRLDYIALGICNICGGTGNYYT